MDASTLLILLVLVVCLSFLFEFLLDTLNLLNYRRTLPGELESFHTPESWAKARAYHRDGTLLGMAQSLVSTVLSVLVLVFGVLGWLDSFLASLGLGGLPLTLAFFALIAAASGIAGLPFSLYSTFGIEARYGFNRTSPGLWLGDLLKGTLLGAIVGGFLLSVLVLLVNALGGMFWMVFAAVALGFSLFMSMFYTSIILPLFNKLTPLEDGELKSAIQDYAAQNGFPLDSIMVMDGSKRSAKANAFFSGLGKKKNIVLFDTLVQKHSIPELVAVLAHEVGHYKKKHVLWGFVFSAVQMLLVLWVLSLMIHEPTLSRALGGTETRIHLGLAAFALLMSPLSGLGGMLAMVFSRRHEYEADAYAAATSNARDLAQALRKLSTDNLGNLQPHPLYVFFNYSHPPLLSRLAALESKKGSQ